MNPILLHIETSTNVCSVALSESGECLFSISNSEGMNHAALLSLFIEKATSVLRGRGRTPDAVAVSEGPGSYTGLRIGVSTAKGLCYGWDIPLIAVNTLQILNASALGDTNYSENSLFCPMIDARRMEVYDAVFDVRGNMIKETAADIIASDSFRDMLEKQPVYFFGNGSDKCKSVIVHNNACFLENKHPLAENMILSALDKFNRREFADTAYFEPFYLKEFRATTPKPQFPVGG
ncbi:MAG: tRNA (adenosine(37)-N6)-threonylcarbamoyltransferase complex dimerization subunit type 1 TsaB [Prevotellaceae bacterium]|jgi:tRNA threonylcarbamoyladenosine biosynthesis protein TsaB|nr:tRNA (adenosine(37)-N6)-threonylcarbamoyltransferase complex dimerization subunit type 1 TsaB [Prevotellaceae bacterium]